MNLTTRSLMIGVLAGLAAALLSISAGEPTALSLLLFAAATLPILIASGYGGPGFETRALSAGVDRVLKKPYRMSEIAEVLAGFFAAKP